jgi:hypothetical protein
MRKGKDPELELDPDPYLWLMDPDPGGPKTCGSCGSGSSTLLSVQLAFPLSLPERDRATRPMFRYYFFLSKPHYKEGLAWNSIFLRKYNNFDGPFTNVVRKHELPTKSTKFLKMSSFSFQPHSPGPLSLQGSLKCLCNNSNPATCTVVSYVQGPFLKINFVIIALKIASYLYIWRSAGSYISAYLFIF